MTVVAAPTAERLSAAVQAMAAAGVDGLLLGPGADLRYLTGYAALESERLTLLLVRPDDEHLLVVPRLERPRAEAAGVTDTVTIVDFDETDDPYALVGGYLAADPSRRFGVGDRLWSSFLLGLQAQIPQVSWTPASTVTRELRMRKSPAEVDALRRAGQAIDRVHAQVPDLLRPGRTEAEVGRDIADRILAEGHEAVSFVIVASGPNGASPHHKTGQRPLETGDAVVVDIGGVLDGYCSDCTRNYVLGEAGEDYAQAHAALEVAQRAACDAVRPGVTAAEVDAAARDLLAAAGYGEWFVHRTGHGIGLETHEDPYIVAGNPQILEPGMAFSVEPGIYLPDRFGLRIEDIVVVDQDGCERLNTSDRTAVTV